jgi:hypothetical protein
MFGGFVIFVTMNKERYDIVANPDRTLFEFNSDGPNGTIKKEIQYTLVNAGRFFTIIWVSEI